MVQVVLQYLLSNLAQRCLHGSDLMQHVRAGLSIFGHLFDGPHVPLDPGKSGEYLRRLWVGVSMGQTTHFPFRRVPSPRRG